MQSAASRLYKALEEEWIQVMPSLSQLDILHADNYVSYKVTPNLEDIFDNLCDRIMHLTQRDNRETMLDELCAEATREEEEESALTQQKKKRAKTNNSVDDGTI